MRRGWALALAVICALIASSFVVVPGRSAVAAGVHAPVGAFDGLTARFGNPSVFANTPDLLQLSGWAADQDEPGHALDVHVWVNGRAFLPWLTGTPRPDVQAAHPWAGPNTGWRVTIPANAIQPDATICMYAIDAPPGGAPTLLGCRSLATPSPKDPIGSFDAAYASPGQIRLQGWAGDPDGSATTRLRVFYDPHGFPGALTPMLEPSTSLARPDVRAAFPKLSLTTGFDLVLPIPPGVHSICLTAQNTGPSGPHNLELGCVRGTVPDSAPAGPHDPRGGLDRVRPSPTHCGGDAPTGTGCWWHATGWAYDPDTGAPVAVRVRTIVWGDRNQAAYPVPTRTNAVRISTGVSRPDVQRLIPAAGPSAGFDGLAIQARSGYVTMACAIAINVGPGRDRLIGCFANPSGGI